MSADQTLYVGIDWSGLSAHIAEKAIEKAQRNSLPNLTHAIMFENCKSGFHQGVWEVICNLLVLSKASAENLCKLIKPNPAYIHEFDMETLEEIFLTKELAIAWIGENLHDSSDLDAKILPLTNGNVHGKVGDKIEVETIMNARIKGIELAISILNVYDAQLADEVASVVN